MRLSRAIVLLGLLLALAGSAFGDPASGASVPTTAGKFKLISKTISQPATLDTGAAPVETNRSEYTGNGVRALVEAHRFQQETQAYELLSLVAIRARGSNSNLEIVNGIGTAGFATDQEIAFVKGTTFVSVRNLNGRPADLNELANAWSESLEKGEGDIPPLIKHLPNPEQAQKNAVYLNSFADLHRLPFQHAVFDAVQSLGNADAALATYGPTKVLIVEFNTPQLATENDKRIIARIQELWKLGQPAPTAYRRVGNYSVFVFDAPDESTAKQLIDQVKYEQVVQWLGENPNILKEAQKRYVNTTLGVLVTVLKASGYALITCLGMGGLIGALLFSYRRSQQKAATAYSDAGGMLRLNLDELTPETDPGRLLRERN
ncbi:MAG TPA: hypothetical protein VJR02_15855 [Pyrinomonadaceae bacterium]|nr:hypothetical protein [Pyrinomonadaceae bacterium]